MIADRHEIAAAARDGTGELHVTAGTKPPEVGKVHALQPAVGRPARYYGEVLDVWEHRGGGWVVIVRIVAREVPVRYLTRNGETTDAGSASRDPSTGAAEWMPPRDWVDPGAQTREDYRATLESETLARMLPEVDNWDDFVRLKQLARSRGVDISSDLRVIEARIEAIGRKLRREAA